VRWEALPPDVRRGVEDVLGSSVVHARSQPGGFSPGSADRVRTRDGRRAFVKAVGSRPNPDSPALHRAEARVAGWLPAQLPVPALLGAVEVDDWVAVVLADVDGSVPALPWRVDDLDAVLAALSDLAVRATPCPVPELPDSRTAFAAELHGFDRLAADRAGSAGLPALPDLDLLREWASRGTAALSGDTLVHGDLRADNVLVTAGGAVLVDWPWASRGPAWLDTVLLLIEVERCGGHDVDVLLATLPQTREVDPDDVTGVLAGFAGYFLDTARRPPPPGLPTVREFQRVQGVALLEWVRDRVSGGRRSDREVPPARA
jgi:aminoglycoside phosphotransferase (APT) family kinase protein